MKIVHCIYSLNYGGAETLLIDVINEQSKNHIVTLIIINSEYDSNLLKTISKRVSIVFINRKAGSRSIMPILKLNYKLITLSPNIIHIHNESIAKIILPVFRNIFLTVHCLGVPSYNFHRLKGLYAISESVKDDVRKKGEFPVITIPNGIDLTKIEKREPSPFKERMRIVQVARLDYGIKGQDILIKALAILTDKGYDITVDFIGEGCSLEELTALCKELGVYERVKFLGLRSREYIYSHLKEYDLLCHPARFEGFGLVVAEGMAANLPVLVPDKDGAYEVIDYGKFGSSFCYGEEKDCAKSIEHIFNNYIEALKLLPQAYGHISKNYSLTNMVDEYIANYK